LRLFKSGARKGIPTEHEESVRQQILEGLIADKEGDEQVSTATRILAEVIVSDAAWLMLFNGFIQFTIRQITGNSFGKVSVTRANT
jgi:hypothetical protein